MLRKGQTFRQDGTDYVVTHVNENRAHCRPVGATSDNAAIDISSDTPIELLQPAQAVAPVVAPQAPAVTQPKQTKTKQVDSPAWRVACPRCKAQAGAPCVRKDGKTAPAGKEHGSRIEAAS
jgi:hypothetical protein